MKIKERETESKNQRMKDGARERWGRKTEAARKRWKQRRKQGLDGVKEDWKNARAGYFFSIRCNAEKVLRSAEFAYPVHTAQRQKKTKHINVFVR